MQMGWGRNRDGVDALGDQPVEAGKCPATTRIGDPFPTFRVGIGDTDQPHSRQIGEDAGVIAAHNANTHHADAENSVRASFRGLHHG
jgi:hypothetical protein